MELLNNLKILLDGAVQGIKSLKDNIAANSDNLKELVENAISNELGEIDRSLIECNDVITDKENTQEFLADTWIESAKSALNITTMPNDNVTGNDNIFILGKTALVGKTLANAFYGCHNIYIFDTDGWQDNHEITNMSNMCRECTSLVSIDMSNINTERVITFAYAFNLCSSLKKVDMRGKITSSATKVQYMFDSCYSLEEVDLSDCDTSNISDFARFFNACRSLKNVITDNRGLDISSYHLLGNMGAYNASLEHFVPYDGSGIGFMAFYNTGSTAHTLNMSASANLDEESVLSVIENLHKYEDGETDRVPVLMLNQEHDKYITAQHYEDITAKGWQISGVTPSMVEGYRVSIHNADGSVKSHFVRHGSKLGYRVDVELIYRDSDDNYYTSDSVVLSDTDLYVAVDQYILNKMSIEQPQLYDSLILWYGPRAQGLTNDYIYNQVIEDSMFILKNLNGNTDYDLSVTGMSGLEGDGYIDNMGRLVFDGLDDVAIGKKPVDLTDSGAYSLFFGADNITIGGFNLLSFSTSNTIRLRTTGNPFRIRYQSLQQTETILTYNDEESAAISERIDFEAYYPSDVIRVNGDTTSVERTETKTNLGNPRIAYSSSTSRTPLALRHYIMFKRDLSNKEVEWVRKNMINI